MSDKKQGDGYEIVPFARIREVVIDVMAPAQKKHNIHVLFEADVTDVRTHLRKMKAETGASLSLTAFLIKCIATAAMTDKRLTARRISRRRLALFDDVHARYTVETEVDGQSHPLADLIRDSNRKEVREIHDQIRSFKSEREQESLTTIRKFAKLPRFLRSIIMASCKKPELIQKYLGTLMVTSVGMFGAGGGHAIPYQDFTLCVAIGGITKKPGIVDDRIEPREFLPITATFDHDIIDGAPAARFTQTLKELVEKGHGLLD